MRRELPFLLGCVYESALLAAALLWGWLAQRPALLDLRFTPEDTAAGLLAAAPPFLFFLWTLKSRLFDRHQQVLESLLRPMFERWTIGQMALISLLAGVCEEALFRGAIQGGLAERVGAAPALVLASLAFGTVHLITWTYGLIAALIGAYLGLLWIWTGNLWAPMVAHAAYDFAALVFYLRFHPPRDGSINHLDG